MALNENVKALVDLTKLMDGNVTDKFSALLNAALTVVADCETDMEIMTASFMLETSNVFIKKALQILSDAKRNKK